jgi:hypothetical protein
MTARMHKLTSNGRRHNVDEFVRADAKALTAAGAIEGEGAASMEPIAETN